MKNIVFVIESLHLGGAEKSLITLLQNLDYQQCNVSLILFNTGGLFLNQVPSEVQIIHKNTPYLSIFSRLYYKVVRKLKSATYHNAQLFWPLIKGQFVLENSSYDIAIAYNQGFATYFVADYINATKKYAWLNIDYKKAGYNINYDYPFYKKFDKVVAVSEEAKISLTTELHKLKKEVHVVIVKDITDKIRVRELGNEKQEVLFPSSKINIVTVGRLAKQKGLGLAVTSCKKLVDKRYDINWYVVGEGGEREYLENAIKENNLNDSFFLLGATENPYTYMKSCDIYVQTSLFEGLGLTVIEASYLNKPIVSTNFDTIYGIIEDGETGLIAEMNPESIASKIERLILDESLRTKFSTNLAKQENKDKEESLRKINELLTI
jgi:glycosyltransferase involved in cell wall biosynthesis